MTILFGACTNSEPFDPNDGGSSTDYTQPAGQGTKSDPYNVSAALVHDMDSSEVWVKGYIVGQVAGADLRADAQFGPEFTGAVYDDGGVAKQGTNLLIAAKADETSTSACLVVQLSAGQIRDVLNLVENPTNDGKEVMIKGQLIKYFGAAGLKNTTAAKFEGQDLGETSQPSGTPQGDGTQNNPYNIAGAAAQNNSGAFAWVKGYIVGQVAGSSLNEDAEFEAPFNGQTYDDGTVAEQGTNLLIADSPSETNTSNCIVVQLPYGDLRTALNLVNNPSNDGMEVTIYGSLAKYFGANGLKECSCAIFNGQTIGTLPGDPVNPGDLQGDGSKTNPYTAADVVALNSNGASGWVKAFIVGQIAGKSISENAEFDAPFTIPDGSQRGTNLLIAADASETNTDNCIAVQLPGNAVRDGINLPEHPEMDGKEVMLYGSIEEYFGTHGVKNVTCAIVDGVTYGTDPGEGGGDTPTGNVVFSETFLNGSLGDFTAYSVVGEQVWGIDTRYGAKMSGYVEGTNYPNEDWLISPALTVEKNNIVQFMAKAGNVNPEHFVVGITTVTDDPQPADFANLTPGNYETADSWAEWRTVQYDLARYEGQTVRIGIHYVGDANRYGCMMLMVDNFYVGQPRYDEMSARVRRISPRSVANPNESFRLYVDGEQVAETEAYTYLFEDLAEGTHTLAVEAVYRSGVVSERATLDVVLSNDTCYALALDVTTDNGVSPDGLMLEVLNKATGEVVAVAVDGGKAEMLSLPRGAYSLSIANELYEPYNEEVVMDEAKSLKAALKEKRFTPYNITADVTEAEDGTFAAVVKWNQDLGFYDSFEEYDDFATAFGEWTSLDVDGLPVYPIALGTVDNVVSFPGSGTASSPAVIPPMVFNPARTQPAMYPSDPASAPVYGDKYAIFFSPQQAQADKWLISPELTVREGYVWRFSLKAYSSMYPEMFSLCVSTAGTDPADFTELDQITLSESDWMQYEVDLAAYAGEQVYLGFRYRAYDGFFSMLDGVYVGPAEEGEAAEVGAVLHYEVSLDGGPVQQAEEPQCTFAGLAEGEHTVSIVAVYASGRSDEATYTFEVKKEAHNGIGQLQADGLVVAAAPGEVRVWTDEAAIALYTPDGCLLETRAAVPGANVFAVAPGVYLVKAGNRTCLTVVR